MKRPWLTIVCLMLICVGAPTTQARQYEPPINLVFIVHEEPLDGFNGYPTRVGALLWLDSLSQAIPIPYKMTYLMGGDMAEHVLTMGDQWVMQQLLTHNHEIGTHFHTQYRLGPDNWGSYNCTIRYGVPQYNPDSTLTLWTNNKTWVSMLTPNNTSVCSWSFLCSTEGQLMQQFGYTASPGNRSEKCLDYTGVLMEHPQNQADDNRLGREIEEDLAANFVYLDHYAQIGNPNAHGYDCTEPAMEQHLATCIRDWLARESINKDSLDYKVWTFGFMTHSWLIDQYYQQQIQTFIQNILANDVGHYTPRGNLIARFSTMQEVVTEYNTWKASHPGVSSFSNVHPYPTAPLINEAMVIPWDNTQESEWIELYNPTANWFNLAGYKIDDGLLYNQNYWQFPVASWLGPQEILVVAHDGANFRSHYGFRPDFEVSGNTGARRLNTVGSYTLHNQSDGCTLNNTTTTPPNTNTAITDGLSWGNDYAGGFTLPLIGLNQTWGRDANSTDTGDSADWHINGNAGNPTPGGKNSTSFFAPQVFVQVDPAMIPPQVPASGGPVVFHLKVGNELPTIQVVDFWTSMVLPNGTLNGPLIQRLNKNLPAHDSLDITITQWVSAASPAGWYRYDVHVGDYPSVIQDQSSFYFQKLGNAGDGPAELSAPVFNGGDLDWGAASTEIPVPEQLSLMAAPNPFNQSTSLEFTLPQPGAASLQIFDTAGSQVYNIYLDDLAPGRHDLTFDARALSSGIYVAVLRIPGQRVQQKLVLLK
jgi:hypothetical protein